MSSAARPNAASATPPPPVVPARIAAMQGGKAERHKHASSPLIERRPGLY